MLFLNFVFDVVNESGIKKIFTQIKLESCKEYWYQIWSPKPTCFHFYCQVVI